MRASGIDHAKCDNSRKDPTRLMKNAQAERSPYLSATKPALNFAARTSALWADRRGVAAIEFGLFAIFLSLALANVTDASFYIYQRMQAENATEVAAQAA